MKEYNHKLIEQKWQKIWEETKRFKTNLNSNKPKYYALDMFPYPSGSGLHIGHPEGYTATDILARLKRMQQFEVLHPIGFDSFGLPAEQFAISTGNSPRDFTLKNIKTFISQLKSLGFSFDWDRQLITSEPYYYKHTQWIFSKLFEHNLAELKEIEVNWCEKLNTVLANEEVLIDSKNNMVSERGNFPVIKKKMKQWVLKITKYADKLFDGLEKLDWPKSIKKLQANWIYNKGKKENGLHLKDWIFARQRYWGEPFPIVHLENGEIYLIDSSNYPIELPKINNYSFSTDGKPALSKAKEWVNFKDSKVSGKMDLNTMPQWAASSWYYIAYLLKKTDSNGTNYILDLDSKEAKNILSKWLPVDLYIGGQEHAVLHLLYARFWNHFLYDIGIIENPEPFKKLYNQGMILGEDGEKMSKSKGNTISPNEIIEKYGADSLRLGEMFMGPLSDDKEWSTQTILAIYSWLNKVFDIPNKFSIIEKISEKELKTFNNFIINFTRYVEDLKLNNAISEMMIFINFIYKEKVISLQNWKYFLQALSLYAPHIASELFSQISDQNIETLNWPSLDNLVLENKVKIVIQQNSKLKNVLEFDEPKPFKSFNLSFDMLDKEKLNFLKELLKETKIEIEGIKKIIYVENKLLNIIK